MIALAAVLILKDSHDNSNGTGIFKQSRKRLLGLVINDLYKLVNRQLIEYGKADDNSEHQFYNLSNVLEGFSKWITDVNTPDELAEKINKTIELIKD